jgi:hypothetical protein
MVFKKTSENGFVFPRSENPAGAFLADFDFDGAILKHDHKQWLNENLVGPAKARHFSSGHWQIDLFGRASKKGSDAHNLVLSGQRVNAVEAYLGPRLFGVPFSFIPHQLGESSPWDTDEFDHELDRSVEIIARFIPNKPPKRFKPHILIPKIHIWKPRPNRKVMDFKLQVLKAQISIETKDVKHFARTIGAGTATVNMLIDIDEVGTTDRALYEYVGTGKSVTHSDGEWIPDLVSNDRSATYGKGDPHPFATEFDMDADEFAGPAEFRFGLRGRVLTFGPKSGLFGWQKKIENLRIGATRDTDVMENTAAGTSGEMSIVESIPAWAK